MNASDDPLEQLLLDANAVDSAQIAAALSDLVGIDSKTSRVFLKPPYAKQSAREKSLAYLLGRKISVLLGKSEDEDALPKVISSETGMASGTAHPTLQSLREQRNVSQTVDNAYFLAAHQIADAIAALVRTCDAEFRGPDT